MPIGVDDTEGHRFEALFRLSGLLLIDGHVQVGEALPLALEQLEHLLLRALVLQAERECA